MRLLDNKGRRACFSGPRRGAFTGAMYSNFRAFQAADRGTHTCCFATKIGDLPIELSSRSSCRVPSGNVSLKRPGEAPPHPSGLCGGLIRRDRNQNLWHQTWSRNIKFFFRADLLLSVKCLSPPIMPPRP